MLREQVTAMSRDLKAEIKLEVIADLLEKVRVPAGGFQGLWFDDLEQAFAVHAVIDEQASERDKVGIARQTIFEVAKRGTITAARLKSELARRCQDFRDQPRVPYVLVSSLTMRHFRGLRKKRLGKWGLSFSDGLPRRFDRSFLRQHPMSKYFRYEEGNVRLQLSGRARSINEAFETATEELDTLRGIWNLYLNQGAWPGGSVPENEPINKIRLGPLHTLHKPSGKPAAEIWWYDLFPARDPFPPAFEREWPKLERWESRVRRVLRRQPMGTELRGVLVRYARALDSRDPEVAFLQLWGILETLTGTNYLGYDETVRRAYFIYGDFELLLFTLKMLRERRNRAVHAGVAGPDSRNAAIRLHRNVADVFLRAIAAAKWCDSLEEFGRFLALPRTQPDLHSSRRELQSAIKLRERALRFHGYTPPRKRKIVKPPPATP